jgi:hypothetical protein
MLPSSVTGYVRLFVNRVPDTIVLFRCLEWLCLIIVPSFELRDDTCKGNRRRINADMQSCGILFSTTRAGTTITGYSVISWASIRKYQPAHRPDRKQILSGSIFF